MPPRALLMYCPQSLASELLSLGWEIAIGAENPQDHPTYKLYASDPPDPRHWNMIIDDRHHANQAFAHVGTHQLPVYPATPNYLSECEKAYGLRFCPRGDESFSGYSVWTRSPRGHKALEFSQTTNERWRHVVDFVEDFHGDFARGRLAFSETWWQEYPRWPNKFTPLFLDAYGDPVLGILNQDNIDWLTSIDIPDAQRRSQAVLYLCTRTAPKLWPDIHAGDFTPKRVVALREELDDLLAKHHAERRRIETAIEEEQTFFSRLSVVVQLGDDALRDKVREIFEDVFGWEATDLDSELPEGEPKRLDLLVQLSSGPALVEVRGSGTRNAQTNDVDRFVENLERYPEVLRAQAAKVLVFNGLYRRPPAVRARHDDFSRDVVDEANAHGVALISARQLLAAIEAYRNGELSGEQFADGLKTPGAYSVPSGKNGRMATRA